MDVNNFSLEEVEKRISVHFNCTKRTHNVKVMHVHKENDLNSIAIRCIFWGTSANPRQTCNCMSSSEF